MIPSISPGHAGALPPGLSFPWQWAAPPTLSFSQSCCHPKHTYRTPGWPCLPEITLRAKQRTQGQSGKAYSARSIPNPNYKSSCLGPPDYPSFPGRGTPVFRGVCSQPVCAPVSMHGIPASTSALTQHTRIMNSFIQQRFTGCLCVLHAGQGAWMWQRTAQTHLLEPTHS